MDLVPHLQQASEIVLGGVVEEVLHYPHVLPVLHCFLFLAQLGDALHVILGKLVHVPIFHAALDTATYLLEHVLDFEVGLVFVLFLLAVLAQILLRFNSLIGIPAAFVFLLLVLWTPLGFSIPQNEGGPFLLHHGDGSVDGNKIVHGQLVSANRVAFLPMVNVLAGAEARENDIGAAFLHGPAVSTIKYQHYYLLLHIQVFQFYLPISTHNTPIFASTPLSSYRKYDNNKWYKKVGLWKGQFLQCKFYKLEKSEQQQMYRNGNQFGSEHNEWLAVYSHVKTQCYYKCIQSEVNSYLVRISSNLSSTPQHWSPGLLIPKVEHQHMLTSLRLAHSKLINHLNLLQLTEMSQCLDHVLEKLIECLCLYHSTTGLLASKLSEQRNYNKEHYQYLSKCSECQQNVVKNKIDSLMGSMTMTSSLLSPHYTGMDKKARRREMDQINHEFPQEHDNTELACLIDEVLERKQMILGNNSKNKSSNLYQEIVQYLQSIPQVTLSLSKEASGSSNSVMGSIQEVNAGNFAEEFQRNFGSMLKQPIRKLILRIFGYARQLYDTTKIAETVGTQTLLIKDEENIKMLLKNADSMRKQLEIIRKAKREAEQDMVRLMDNEQAKQLRITELATENTFMRERLQKCQGEIAELNSKIEIMENSRRESHDKIIKEYTNERSIYMRSIRQLEMKIEVTSNELMRLRKETQSTMVAACVETDPWWSGPGENAEVQTDDRVSFVDCMENNRNSGSNGVPSKKNFIKFSSNRRSINNAGSNIHTANDTDTINEVLQPDNFGEILAKANSRPNGHTKQSKFSGMKDHGTMETETKKKEPIHEQIPTSRKQAKKRESIVDKITQMEEKYRVGSHRDSRDKQNNSDKGTGNQRWKKGEGTPAQTIKIIIPQEQSCTKSQVNLRIDGRSSKTSKDRELFSREISQVKRISPSGNLIRSRAKLQSSRMFISKPHCHPYIGCHSGFSASMGQATWLDMIEVNSSRRETQLRNQIGKEVENAQKIQFLSKLMQKYSLLKQTGLLNRINEIVSSGELQLQSEQTAINSAVSKAIPTQPKDIPIMAPLSRNTARNKTRTGIQQKQLIVSKKDTLAPKQVEVFNKNQVVLVFGSIQWARKYQEGVQIWGNLENSIMLDYNFMALCDGLEIYLLHMQTHQTGLYDQCAHFLSSPIGYLQQKQKIKPRATRAHHERFLSTPLNQRPMSKRPQPHDLRNIFHKILRFHKIVHKKCNHVNEFLAIIGFDSFSPRANHAKI